ncbi:hypothetical protein [Brevundimonas naejangsanensis]|uniref:hypothetical protein n=1 Tax=Brevundimonas naejangsanensis TaxID=588932 RepID=UPI00106CB1FB|nr:hypothetical protein [Brevundimonas naejangsanensis]QBQ47322.1 hypothetical protein E3U41_00675 [Brevundimonas naejangsanensis]
MAFSLNAGVAETLTLPARPRLCLAVIPIRTLSIFATMVALVIVGMLAPGLYDRLIGCFL